MTLAGIVLLVIEMSRVKRITDRWQSVTADAFAFYALSAAKDHEDTKSWEAREFLADLERRTGIRAWMFDEKGREISGYAQAAYRRISPERSGQIRKLMSRTMETHVSEFTPLDQVTLAAHTAKAPSGRFYTLVGELPVLRYGPWQARPYIQVLRFLSVSLTAALVSWLLSRRLTSPISRLRTATHAIAGGNLSARAGMKLRSSSDELEQLAQDFDQMAQRIEVLLEEKEQLVGAQRRLLRDVSHELRSPLTRLNMALELARDQYATPEENLAANEGRSTPSLLATFDRIERESTRLSEMIKQLLTLSRFESGISLGEPVKVNLCDLVRSITADAVFEAEQSGGSLEMKRCDDCHVKAYPDLLHSAIENVVRNALLHTPEGKSVEIELFQATSKEVCVRIRDFGGGVPEDKLQEIFEPFYRTPEARERKSGGSGLGLAITKRAVESHGGKVKAYNSVDGGLVIEICLTT